MFKTMKEVEKEISDCEKAFGFCKVNLVHEHGENEGIWAVAVDVDSKTKMDLDTSNDEFVFVRLCNQPLGWNKLTWGGLVRAKTRGTMRPDALLEDQDLPELKADRKNLVALAKKELAKPKKKAKAKK